ncbi:hypothetical protein GGI59_006182 [Rhizobium lentis]|uniref:Uncharacterized protein n=2 Tax=Rhizobium lentis TaxID=1138194 RepID=A0A7W8XKA7_9HYPH|nr:hypothetical protein [Rhizobium lentis]MBB5564474.1 hypothetical protein [Rhizobium lentis]MBB5570915.1 hypothetical protein [Rhizobium lentis]
MCGLSVTANKSDLGPHAGGASVMPFDLKELDLRSAQSLRRRIRALAYAGKVNCEAFVPR